MAHVFNNIIDEYNRNWEYEVYKVDSTTYEKHDLQTGDVDRLDILGIIEPYIDHLESNLYLDDGAHESRVADLKEFLFIKNSFEGVLV